MFDNIYKGRRVLVTGHTGFKGSWITLWLLELGAKVCGFSDDISTDPANFVIQGLEKKIVHVKGDIRNLNDVQNAINRFRPEIVFHLAAQSLVRKSYDAPLQTFITNTTGTLNVLEVIRLSPDVKAGVIVTSDKCYHNSEWTWGYRENDTLGGDDPYSASKGCAELVTKSYNASYFSGSNKRLASTRAGNVIGGGDWADDRIIPDLVRAWSDNKPVVIRNPDAIRPWQHVFEPLSGYLWLGAKLMIDSPDSPDKFQEAFNFGPLSDSIYTVRSVLDTIGQYLKGASWKVENIDNFKKESSLLNLCCDKALNKLKWHSVLSFDETIEMTAKWYEAYYKKSLNQTVNQTLKRTREISLDQLNAYVAKAEAKGLEWSK